MTWIAVDWGGSNLRAWLMQDDTAVAEAGDRSAGARTLNCDEFEPTLSKLIDPWRSTWGDRPVTILICGEAGSREGWFEAPFAQVPCAPRTLAPTRVPTQDAGLHVYMMPGLSQLRPKPTILRGEETQISGFLASHPTFEGVICLPGTHSKWAHVSAEEIVSFETTMTGEMYDLLAETSILRHSVAHGDPDGIAFDEGVDVTLSNPERLVTELAAIRASHVLTGATKTAADARLSGLLIGAEIAALKPYWLGQQVALIGREVLCGLYARALSKQGVPADRFAAGPLTQAGLFTALGTLDSPA
ncbi:MULTISPECIES: 2-dehydro-3-deoxygalactonokinase [Thalassobacter]|uniref:2-dehydro-3-deoxygalactonokinase n=1 Tax=Thalassobacter TaxID=266808 RepID=UPI000570D517|nr:MULTISPECIES: 2-dehydro-3-deoxygalactonokinase [Thalassobacter]